MADSENSRTLPSITRRNLLLQTAASPPANLCLMQQAAAALDGEPLCRDPAVCCWQEWLIAHEHFAHLCERQTRLETMLSQEMRFPALRLDNPGEASSVSAFNDGEIEAFLDQTEHLDAHIGAEAKLVARRAAWDAADKRIGYSRAKEEEEEASEVSRLKADALFAVPAQSILGIIAKVHVVIANGEPRPDSAEFPWPQLRSIMADLLRYDANLPIS